MDQTPAVNAPTAPRVAAGAEHADACLARFASDLPEVAQLISLGEGDTPVLPLPRLAARIGLPRLSAKLEHLNPTGSYKDRIAAMSVSLAVHRDHAGWVATSSGNAGLAMAAYGRRAGLPGFLCIVASAPAEKKIPIAAYGVGLLGVEDVGLGGSTSSADEMLTEVARGAERHNLFLAITAHAYNPDGMRGADTIGYELAEQALGATHVYVPVGGGGLLVAIARGLRQRHAAARVVACQPSGCAPIVRYLAGEIPDPTIPTCESAISALQLPHPPDADLAVAAVRESGGWATAAPDEAIHEAQRLLLATEGIFVEPAAASSLAALIRDLDDGRVARDDEPVIVLTGAGWKDLGAFAPLAEQIPRVGVEAVPGAIDAWAQSIAR